MILSERAPRLILVSPAMDFHPTTETVLKYFHPSLMLSESAWARPGARIYGWFFEDAGQRGWPDGA